MYFRQSWRLWLLQTLSVCVSVCLSVCLSVCVLRFNSLYLGYYGSDFYLVEVLELITVGMINYIKIS